ncbi:unnamed protein product [Parnassius mnemosyne]|uniref:Envelope protein n=1 Tax=Parnassius mnemosyne TaxID=213953 RepID=A0AAV1L0R3_9NEOP
MIDIDVLGSMLSKLRSIYSSDQILNLELRDYYDVIKPGSYYTEKQIVFIFKFPITSRDNFDLYKLSIVPNKNSQALIPTYPFMATNELSFAYIETECPKFNHWYLCEERTTYQIRTQPDCIQELITKQVIQEACNLTTIILSKEAMEKLDDQHYILSFPHYTKVQLSCGRKEFTMLQGSYLITIPASCLLKTAEFTIVNDNNEIKGQPLKLTGLPFRSPEQATASTRIHLNSIYLQGLHSIQDKILMQSPVQLRAISDTLYHTTIPFYIILSSGGILIFVLATRRYISRCRKETSKAAQSPTSNSEDHGNPEIPATFSLNILK